jgi:hypothetical protein
MMAGWMSVMHYTAHWEKYFAVSAASLSRSFSSCDNYLDRMSVYLTDMPEEKRGSYAAKLLQLGVKQTSYYESYG